MAMAEAERPARSSPGMGMDLAAGPAGVVWSALAAVAAAWTAAGSTGLLAHPLRHSIIFLLLAASVVCGYAGGSWTPKRLVRWLAAGTVLALMLASAEDVINVLACACVPAALA